MLRLGRMIGCGQGFPLILPTTKAGRGKRCMPGMPACMQTLVPGGFTVLRAMSRRLCVHHAEPADCNGGGGGK